MKKLIPGSLIVLMVFAFVVLAAGTPTVSRAQIAPTDQQATIDALVQQFFEQTRQAPPSGQPDQAATATAAFQSTVQMAFQRALTATALAANPGGVILGTVKPGSSINLRSCPATSCGVIDSIPAGTQIPILFSQNGWYLTALADGTSGYVSASLVTLPDGADLSKLPTLTPSPTPSPTSTRTPTPTRTPTSTPTPNYSVTQTLEALGKLVEPKGDGAYIVGVDIQPGHWRSTGTDAGCAWERFDRNGNSLDSDSYALAGGTINIRRSDYQVTFGNCGEFIYVEGEPKVLSATAEDAKGTGWYRVGVDIVPGRWDIYGAGSGCYWARYDTNHNILQNHFGASAGTIVVRPGDYEIEIVDCGRVEYQKPS